jgi:hypothetical protein
VSLSLADVRRHRGELLERARAQRESIRATLDSQRNTFWLADRALALGKLIAARKGLVLVGALAFAVVQPRRALRWAFNIWSLIRLVRKVSRAFAPN